jgi:phosphate starvation-inducible PhoH-like protein
MKCSVQDFIRLIVLILVKGNQTIVAQAQRLGRNNNLEVLIMKGRNNTPHNLEAKQTRGEPRAIKEKFAEQREEQINSKQIKPLNAKQKHYMEMFNNPDCGLILASGYAGTSKTYIPTALACDLLRTNKISKIVFTRPNISNSKSLGFFGGSLIEKMSNWLMPVMDILKDRLGQNALELYIKHGDIVFMPLEVVKGYSANDCVFICDEAEDLTIEEAKKLVTRQGKNCKMVLAGDISQSELKEKSGLKYIIDMARKYDDLELGLVDFNETGDIVRSEQVKQWILAFNKEEKQL